MNELSNRLLALGERAASAGASRTCRPSQVANLTTYLLAFGSAAGLVVMYRVLPWHLHYLWLVAPLAFLSMAAIGRYFDTRCTSYKIDGERILWASGVLSRETVALELYQVQYVVMTQTLAERIFGIGTVFIHTSDHTRPWVGMYGIRNPEQLRAWLTDYVQVARRRRGVQEVSFG